MAVSAEAVVLKVDDARRAAAFWTAALGYEAEEGEPDFLVPPQGNGVRLHLDERDRTHLDLWLDRSTSDLDLPFVSIGPGDDAVHQDSVVE